MAMKCPACKKGNYVYKCNNCGEVRCDQSVCTGTYNGKKGAASRTRPCISCSKGRYEMIK